MVENQLLVPGIGVNRMLAKLLEFARMKVLKPVSVKPGVNEHLPTLARHERRHFLDKRLHRQGCLLKILEVKVELGDFHQRPIDVHGDWFFF